MAKFPALLERLPATAWHDHLVPLLETRDLATLTGISPAVREGVLGAINVPATLRLERQVSSAVSLTDFDVSLTQALQARRSGSIDSRALHRVLRSAADRLPGLPREQVRFARDALLDAHATIPASAGLSFADVLSGRCHALTHAHGPDETQEDRNLHNANHAIRAGVPAKVAYETFSVDRSARPRNAFNAVAVGNALASVLLGSTIPEAAELEGHADNADFVAHLNEAVAEDSAIAGSVRSSEAEVDLAERLGLHDPFQLGLLHDNWRLMAVKLGHEATKPDWEAATRLLRRAEVELFSATAPYVQKAFRDGRSIADVLKELPFEHLVALRMLRHVESKVRADMERQEQ